MIFFMAIIIQLLNLYIHFFMNEEVHSQHHSLAIPHDQYEAADEEINQMKSNSEQQRLAGNTAQNQENCIINNSSNSNSNSNADYSKNHKITSNFIYTFKKILTFFKNKNLLYLIVFLLTRRVGFNSLAGVLDYHMLKNNIVTRPQIADLYLSSLPITVITSLLTTRIIKKKLEFSIYLKTFFILQFNDIFIFLILKLNNG